MTKKAIKIITAVFVGGVALCGVAKLLVDHYADREIKNMVCNGNCSKCRECIYAYEDDADKIMSSKNDCLGKSSDCRKGNT